MPERVNNVFQQWSVGSVQQNIIFYFMITVVGAMVVGQHTELNAREKKPMMISLRHVKPWRILVMSLKRLLHYRKKRSLLAAKQSKEAA